MTHHSSLRYGGGRAFCDNGSCAKSGPVRVRYFDPATGEPLAERPKGRRGKRRDKPLSFEPGSVPPCAVAVTVDGGLLQDAAPGGRDSRCDSAEELCRAYDGRGGCLLMPREAMRRKGTGAVLAGVPQCAGRYGALLRESPFCRAMMDFMRLCASC